MSEPIDYATPRAVEFKPQMLRSARACGTAPLCVGVLCTIGALIAGDGAIGGLFAIVGMFTLFFGLILVLLGLVFLSIYAHSAKGSGAVDPSMLRRQRLGTIVLLLVNFPAAALCLVAGAWGLRTVVPVEVTNSGTTTVVNCRLRTPDGDRLITSLAPGRSQTFKLDASGHGGAVMCELYHDGRTISREITRWGDEDDAHSLRGGIKVTLRDGAIDSTR